MARKRKSKPSKPRAIAQPARTADPAEAARHAYQARRNPAMWGTNEEALKLAQNADVGSEAETRTRTRRVQRFDCFATLKLSDHQFTAVRRFQADLAEANGVGDSPDRFSEVIDGGGSRELVTARMMAATNRVFALYAQLSVPDILLLKALSYPTWVLGQQPNWKAEVKRLRGLIDRGAQADAVRHMSEAVREGYMEIDNSARRAA